MSDEKTQQLLQQLKALNLPNDQFAIFGSGPLGIRGLRPIDDLDVVVTKNLWDRLCKKYPTEKAGSGRRIRLGQIEIFFSWYPGKWNIQKLIDEADNFDGIRFVKLEEVLHWKENSNWPIDKKDAEIIKKYLSQT
jgi:hypothetical protein